MQKVMNANNVKSLLIILLIVDVLFLAACNVSHNDVESVNLTDETPAVLENERNKMAQSSYIKRGGNVAEKLFEEAITKDEKLRILIF